jgi:hypothetical protein
MPSLVNVVGAQRRDTSKQGAMSNALNNVPCKS